MGLLHLSSLLDPGQQQIWGMVPDDNKRKISFDDGLHIAKVENKPNFRLGERTQGKPRLGRGTKRNKSLDGRGKKEYAKDWSY
jgi:hypothetical protein